MDQRTPEQKIADKAEAREAAWSLILRLVRAERGR